LSTATTEEIPNLPAFHVTDKSLADMHQCSSALARPGKLPRGTLDLELGYIDAAFHLPRNLASLSSASFLFLLYLSAFTRVLVLVHSQRCTCTIIVTMAFIQKGIKNILQKNPNDVVFLSALRTPVTRAKKGGLRDAYDHELLAAV
jgi:hypothetical protein